MPRWANENAFDGNFKSAAQVWGVPVELLKAVAAQESGFNPRARRAEPYRDPKTGKPRAGLGPTADFPEGGDESRGLMQVLVRTARNLGYKGHIDGLWDPALNIALGAQLLAQLLRTGKTEDAAISAYNAGFSAVRPGDGKRTTNEPGAPFINQYYVDRVKGFRDYFRAQGLPGLQAPATLPQPAGSAGGLALRTGPVPLPALEPVRTYFVPNTTAIVAALLLLVLLATRARALR